MTFLFFLHILSKFRSKHLLIVLMLFSYNGFSQVFSVEKPCLFQCSNDTTAKTIFRDITPNVTKWRWDFGDGTPTVTTFQTRIGHLYTSPGNKNVSLVRTIGGVDQSVETQVVEIVQVNPNIFLGNNFSQVDTVICKGLSLTLDPFAQTSPPADMSRIKFLWSPNGEKTASIVAKKSGCYSVEVIDQPSGCIAQTRLDVKICIEQAENSDNDNYWYFGNNAGIKFGQPRQSTDTTKAEISNDGKINTIEGVSSITNGAGKMLFYTDGKRVYDSENNEVPFVGFPAGTTLGGSATSTQSAIIIPEPSCRTCDPVKYDIITTTDVNGSKQLSYSILDIRENNGKGAITKVNVPMTDFIKTNENIISVANPSDSSYWVISHDFGTNAFRTFKITKNGVSLPTVTSVGPIIDSDKKAQGYLKISPDGKTLAMAVDDPTGNYVELFNFNDATGAVTSPIRVNLKTTTPPSVYGVEFSPDSKQLYVTLNADRANNPSTYSKILKYNISTKVQPTINNSRILIDSASVDFGAIQLAPDFKLYVAIKNSSFLAVINRPNKIQKDSVWYKFNGLNLQGGISQLGLPTQAKVYEKEESGLGTEFIGDTAVCQKEKGKFQIQDLCTDKKPNKIVKYSIYKQIPSNPNALGTFITSEIKDKNINPSANINETEFTFPDAGVFNITATITNECKTDTTLENPVQILVKPLPNIIITGPTKICEGTQPFSYTATPGSGIFEGSLNINIAGVYTPTNILGLDTIAYKVTQRGCYGQKRLDINTLPLPNVSLGLDKEICKNNIDFIGFDPEPNVTYKWNSGENVSKIFPKQTKEYILTAKLDICEKKDTINVLTKEIPQIPLPDESIICVIDGKPIKLNAGGFSPEFVYTWSTMEFTPEISVITPGIYKVIKTSFITNCSNQKQTVVIDRCEPIVLAPNVFTPNGDNKNDSFLVLTRHISDYKIKIFNRWGELVFSTNNPDEAWDGKINNQTITPDTYAWEVNYIPEYFPERGRLSKKGAVTLLK